MARLLQIVIHICVLPVRFYSIDAGTRSALQEPHGYSRELMYAVFMRFVPMLQPHRCAVQQLCCHSQQSSVSPLTMYLNAGVKPPHRTCDSWGWTLGASG
jgi:hypothetical protein